MSECNDGSCVLIGVPDKVEEDKLPPMKTPNNDDRIVPPECPRCGSTDVLVMEKGGWVCGQCGLNET